MRFIRMTEIQEDLFQRIRDIRTSKGMEYATEEDTLADFKEVAAETGVDPIKVWSVYVKKHLRAVDSFVRTGDVRSESIESRILDVVVYHILLLGLIEDLREKFADWDALLGTHDGKKEHVPFPDMGPDPDGPEDVSINDGEYLQFLGTDGTKWADEFITKFAPEVVGYHSPENARHAALAWFANAIEAGRDAGYKQGVDSGNVNG